jgi:2-oxoglutarate ferredoxin oxidoreductase subunit alpha
MMQARWGSHGDYGMIALCPNSPQECFDLTIKAFNLSEEFRTPVMFMMDECVGHMTEKVVIPSADKIDVYPRRHTTRAPGKFRLYEPAEDLVPAMAHAGEGYRFHVTGLTHDERGYPSMTVATQDKLVRRLLDKIQTAEERLTFTDEAGLEDAEVAVVSYGITSRVAQRAIDMARERGVKAGRCRLIGVWPFPDMRLRQIAQAGVKAFVVPELNLGQISREVERATGHFAKTIGVTHAGGGVHRPDLILNAILEAAK